MRTLTPQGRLKLKQLLLLAQLDQARLSCALEKATRAEGDVDLNLAAGLLKAVKAQQGEPAFRNVVWLEFSGEGRRPAPGLSQNLLPTNLHTRR